jgi:putative membrane protein
VLTSEILSLREIPTVVFADWHVDFGIVIPSLVASLAYAWGIYAYRRRRLRSWSWACISSFIAAVLSLVFALESPLDDAADSHFAPHMLQHLILTDVTAPLFLLAFPLRLWLGAVPRALAHKTMQLLHQRIIIFITSPPIAWLTFIVTLWAVHFSPFYEAALEHENMHIAEHVLFLTSATLFWLPILGDDGLAARLGNARYPMRMLYVLLAMPAEAFLGFVLYSARAPLYAAYRAAGVADQQAAGEIMWVGATAVMFVAFMLVGVEWARHEQRLAES